jgi:hypothetical protein
MFIGAKMLAEPWVHISTGLSLAIVGGIIALSILISVIRARFQAKVENPPQNEFQVAVPHFPPPTPEYIHRLGDSDQAQRRQVARDLYSAGTARTMTWLDEWRKDGDLRALIILDHGVRPDGVKFSWTKLTIGIAVQPETFEKIRQANGSPPLADVPPDQDVLEFELEFKTSSRTVSRIDILTTKTPGGNGAIARFLEKFGEGIQQLELDVTDVDWATEILRTRFKIEPVYPAIRPGANGTRVNFFLVTALKDQKVLVELVEQPKGSHQSPNTSH